MKKIDLFFSRFSYIIPSFKINCGGIVRLSILLAFIISAGLFVQAQTFTVYTSPPLTPNNGSGGVTFEVESTQPIEITQLLCIFSTGATSANVWVRTGGVQHIPGQINISTANGWAQVITGAVITGADNTTLIPINFGTTVIPVQANTRIGFHIEGNTRYQTGVAADPSFLTDGILSVIVADSASYGGPPPTPPNNPRRFTGAVTYQLQASGVPNDAGVISINSPVAPISPGLHSVSASIRNFGSNQISSVNVNWSVNGVVQTPVPYTTLLDTIGGLGANQANVTIGSFNFPAGFNTIKAWTSLPNNQPDTFNINDTSQVTIYFATTMSGTYTIGGTTPDFTSFGNALTALYSGGISGPVTFNVAPGTYTEQVTFNGNISGSSSVNTITFQSATGDSTSVILTGSGAYILQFNGADYIKIKQITIKTTVTSSTKVIEIIGGADYNTITNCVIETPPTTTSTAYGIYNSSGLDNNNVITNNNIKNGYYAIYWYGGSSTSLETGNRIEGNKLEGFYYYGIYSYGQNAMVIKGNTIINSASSGSVYGIYMYYNDNDHQTIGNTILITGTSTLYGINIYYCDGTTSLPGLTANNMIVVNGSSTRYAIRNYYSSYQNLYHNSTHVTGTGATGYGLYLYNSSASYTGHNIINNIFSNTSASGYAAYYYNATNLTSTDYNNFYSTGNNFVYYAAAIANLAALQTASGKDLNSMSVDPSFLSNTDLHTNSVPLFHTGTSLVNVTVDIDGDPRHPTTPCIGADEYMLYSNDAGVSELTEPLSVCPGIVTSIKVKIKNFGIQAFTGASVNWKVNGVSQAPFLYTSLLASGASQEVTIGTYTFASGVLYDMVFWTTGPGSVADQNPANDTLKVLGFQTAMSGILTIGSGVTYDFNSISAAVAALNNYGVCGPIIFNIAAGTYTEQVTLNEIVGASAINTITFQGTTTSNQDVVIEYTASGTADNWTVRFNGTDYTTFKNLTIKAKHATYGRVVEMINGADHNTIENNQLISAGASSSTTSCIYDYNTLNHYNTYRNNYMSGGYYTVYVYGSSSTVWETGTIIEGNDIVHSYYYPIYAYYQDGIQILNNRIYDGVSPYSYGIYNYYPNNAYRVTGNEVYITSTTSTASYGIRDYYGNYYSYNASPTGYGIVANNMVGITGGTAANYGIYAYYSNGTEYYHNSFLMEGGSTSSYCLYQGNTTSNTLGQTFINNTMTNRVGGYAAYFATTASVTTSNYNNFYSSASNLAYWGVLTPDLASLQAASGKDVNSVSLNPPHTSVKNLRLKGLQLSGKGTNLTQVTTDIDGKPRATYPTIGAHEIYIIPFDAGVTTINSPTTAITINEGDIVPVNVVVENYGTSPITSLSITYSVNNGTPVVTSFTPNILPGTNTSFALPSFTSPQGQIKLTFYTILSGDTNNFNDSAFFNYYALALYDGEMVEILPVTDGCGMGQDSIKILIANRGIMPINGNIIAGYKLAGSLTSVTQPVTTLIPVGDTILFVFNTPADFSVTVADSTFTIVTWVDLLNDNVLVNDTAILDVVSLHIPAPPVLTAAHVPYGTPATLVATTTYDVNWYDSDTSTTILATSPTYVTPPLTDSTTYWASAVSGSSITSVGINVAPLATANANNCSTGPCSSFNDLNYGTCGTQQVWISTSGGPTPHNDFIDFEWTVPYTIDKMVIHHGATGTRFLSGGALYTWQNNAWVYLSSFTGLPITICENEVTFPVVTTTKFRITSFELSGSQLSNPNFREIEIFTAVLPGCEGPRVPITANIIPTVTILTPDTTICEGSSINLFVALTGTPPWTLEVSDGTASTMVPGITLPTFAVPVTPTSTTTFSIINIADYTNTFFPDNVQVTITVQPAPVVSITGAADTICETSAVVLDAGSGFASYLWSDASTSQTLSITGASIGAGNSGTFSVSVTDNIGCEGSGQVTIHVIDCSGIDELLSNGTIHIWPNPNSGTFSMKISGISGEATLHIMKTTGELVKTENLILGNETIREFNLGNLAAGIYYIRLITKQGTITDKVMIR